MTEKEYWAYREAGKTLNIKILDCIYNDRENVMRAGKLLGFLQNDILVFDKEDDSNTLADFIFYETNRSGKKLIDLFYDSDIELTVLEEELLEGRVNYCSSLFEIVDIDISTHTLKLKDLLHKQNPDFILMDINFSRTATKDIIIYTRLFPVKDIYMTTGVSFAFLPSAKDRLINEIANEKFRKRRNLTQSELYLLIHKKSKLYGLEVLTA